MSFPDQRDPGSGSARRSRTALLVAGGFLLLIVVCLVVVLTTRNSQSNPPSAPGTAPPAASGPTDGDQTVPTTAPPGVSWTVFHGVALPSSPVFGPSRIDGDVASGFAHSPTGALMAVTNISTRLGFSPDWRPMLEQQTVPGPGRDALAAVLAPHTTNVDQPSPGSRGQYTAFRFVNYSPDVATIQIVNQFAAYGGVQQLATMTVRWSGQDWVLQLQPNGAMTTYPAEVTSLVGFTPWGAQ